MRPFLALTFTCALAWAQDHIVTKSGARVECTILEVREDRLIVKVEGKKYSVKKTELSEWKRGSRERERAAAPGKEAQLPEGSGRVKVVLDRLVKKLAQPQTDSNAVDHRGLAERLASLLKRRKDAAEYATVLLRSGPADARGWVALALAQAGVKEAAPELLEMLKSSPPKKVPAPLIEALGHFGGKKVLPALLKVLPALNPPAKAAAATVLGRTKDRRAGLILVRLLEEGDYDVRSAARMALLPMAKEDDELAEIILARAEDSKHPGEYARLFAQLDDPSCLPMLRSMLRNGDNMARRAAVAAIVRYKDPESVELLLDIASDKDTPGWLRKLCLSSLQRMGDKSVEPKLVELLERSGEDRRVKRAAHGALRGLTGKNLPANPSLWRQAVKRELVEKPPPEASEAEGTPAARKEVVLPAESRPTGPPPEVRKRRAFITWGVLAGALVLLIGGHKLLTAKKKPKKKPKKKK